VAFSNAALTRPPESALSGAIEALAARFGNSLITSQAVREQHAHTTTWLPMQPPDAVVMAQNTEDVQDVVRICAKHGVPVIPFGTGTSLEGQVNAPAGGICIDLREMNRIIEVHADDLDCVIEPGVTRKALNEHLRDQGLFFPIDPGADASIGGMAATRASGTNAVRYGTMKDNILALKVVRADGEIITTGTRAKKSSAGYDLTHLFIGAEGTLGIITEITLKLRGIPQSIAAGACSFETVKGACDATILAIQTGIPVARIELLNAAQVRACNAYSKLTLPETPLLLLEFHGTEADVAEQSAMFGDIAKECGGGGFEWATRPEDRTRLWQARHDALTGRCAGFAPARRRWRRTFACRSRGWPNASPKPRRIWRPPAHYRRSSAMSATAISIAPCWCDVTDPDEMRVPMDFCIGWWSARRRWAAPAPASTAIGQGKQKYLEGELGPEADRRRCAR
jgi:D-lactate dehydrogenase (cytochrome)